MERVRIAALFVAAVVAGSLFAPVFGVWPLLLAMGATAVPAFGVAVWLREREAWRAVGTVVAGLAGLWAALRPADPVRALVVGATGSWRSALQSTWPVRPEPEALVFVPLLVLVAAVFGVELLRRAPLAAFVPVLAVAGLSQAYSAAGWVTAVAAVVAFGACGAVVLARRVPWIALAAGLVGAVVLGLAPTGPSLSLREQPAGLASSRVTSPLVDLPARLAQPGTPVFEYSAGSRVERWPIAVLDEFDGVNWTPGSALRRMGTGLPPGGGVRVPTESRSAVVRLRGLDGPWLPSQAWPATVEGVDPLVDPARGTLLAEERVAEYELTWWEPRVDGLADAAVDPGAPGGFGGVGSVPAAVDALAERAVSGMRSSFRTALLLERFLRENYELVTSGPLPVGHGWPQLERFLLHEKRGTSEQFAAAYVALARIRGIPARLVVGFSSPAEGTVVRNGDAVAWPEVAVAGVGWVALDPTGDFRGSSGEGLPQETEQAREELPPAGEVSEPSLPVEVVPPASSGFPRVVGVLLLVGGVAAVPGVGVVRSWRRRRVGTVEAACAEVRDRLRRNGIAVTPAMTVREWGAVAPAGVGDAVLRLADAVDAGLWSGAGVDASGRAWEAVREVRSGLGRLPLRVRVRAAFRW
ncbi:DUF3488 and transglutaminase-like domain-containing protein [Actinosynnema sp. CA-248983]